MLSDRFRTARTIICFILMTSVMIHQTKRSPDTLSTQISEAIQHLRASTFYEKLQSLVVEYVRHFEEFGEMTILTAQGYKTIPFNEEINNILDVFMKIILQLEHNRAAIHDPNFLDTHPINGFRFVRNNTIILDKIIGLIQEVLHRYGDLQNIAKLKYFQTIRDNGNFIPNLDVNRTIHRILLHQYQQSLQTTVLAGGLVGGQQGEGLSALEGMEVATYARTRVALQVYAATWMETARQIVQQGDTTVDLVRVLETLTAMYQDWGGPCQVSAIHVYTELLNLHTQTSLPPPQPSKTPENTNSHQACLVYINKPREWNRELRNLCQDKYQHKKPRWGAKRNKNEPVCQIVKTNEYKTTFQPLKLETISIQPSIFIIHDFISEKEAQVLRESARAELKQVTKTTENDLFPMRRKSYSVTPHDNKTENIVKTIQSKIATTTNLPKDRFREFKIVKYETDTEATKPDLGNEPVIFDIHESGEDYAVNMDNHTVSVFIYLNDVEAGGETGFPLLAVKVQPAVHAALFVDYLNPDDTWSDEILHGSCPITQGEKWIGVQILK